MLHILRRTNDTYKESYRLCKNDYETDEEASAQQKAVEPLMNEMLHKSGIINI
jgi:hypothetical protein